MRISFLLTFLYLVAINAGPISKTTSKEPLVGGVAEDVVTVTAEPAETTTMSLAARVAAGKSARLANRRGNRTTTTTTTLSPEAAMADTDVAAPLQCSLERCAPPFCQCIIAQPPFGMSLANTPQLVLMVFHDSVTKDSLDVYRRLFPLTRRNGHGCAQAATIFVDVTNSTDYCLVAKLWERGMEIALTGSTSAAQSRGQQFWQQGSVEELTETMVEWREQLHKRSHVPMAEIRGWRTPFSQSGGDKQFSALKVAKFLYDSTLTYRNPVVPASEKQSGNKSSRLNVFGQDSGNKLAFLHNQFYPFTFDFNPTVSSQADCTSYPCPGSAHPGVWEVPMSFLTDLEGELCRFADNCQHQPEDENEMLAMLQMNLFRAYKHRGNRAPIMFNFGARWHTKDYLIKALDTFLSDLSKQPDIFVVTLTDAIRWMQQPMPISKIHKLDSWQCKTRSTIRCRSEGSVKLGLRSGSTGGSSTGGGWDPVPITPLLGRFSRHMWIMEVVVLTLIYFLLRYRDRRQQKEKS